MLPLIKAMPSRYDVFYNGGIYHIYNKTIDNRQIFTDKLSQEFINTFCYYRSDLSSKLRYSVFKELPNDIFKLRWEEIFYRKYFMVDILSFCLLPNHYHFLIKQVTDKGVIRFMANISNSLTRNYNIKNDRKGPVFLPQFKSKRIKNQELLIHVSRYIHTNPYAHELVKLAKDIFDYPYSSIKSYTSSTNTVKINTDKVMPSFGNDPKRYKQFILNNAEDQKTRELVKYTESWIR